MTHLVIGLGHPLLHHLLVVLRARFQATLEFDDGRRQYEHADHVVPKILLQLLRTLPIDISNDIQAAAQRALDRRARRAIPIAEDLRVFEKLILRDRRPEVLLADEPVMRAIDLAAALWPRRRRDGNPDLGIARDKALGDGRLPCARRRGEHQQQTPPLSRERRYSDAAADVTTQRSAPARAIARSPP